MNCRDELKQVTSIFDIPIPTGCDRVKQSNPLAHIYLMAYYQNTKLLSKFSELERFEIDYSPQEGLVKRQFVKKDEE